MGGDRFGVVEAGLFGRDASQVVIAHAALGHVGWLGTARTHRANGPGLRPHLRMRDPREPDLVDRVRRYLAANPRYAGRIVNCMGMRADESVSRALGEPWRRMAERNSVAMLN